ncbi:uncharacterized protein L3040_000701 [Drepanopeziza brunnea f. sp. 'multigermtubi']|uniref:uncharacterized protein n=1 Tax=Drepanopeziza brunnea f. sp. 'multigermtubi' TaxID=698441 RepID=UPI0023A08A2E|nr:hypothetical protein L3040_000701 [Drepanopeziza brunnea f. sp. 'multigermtubi']
MPKTILDQNLSFQHVFQTNQTQSANATRRRQLAILGFKLTRCGRFSVPLCKLGLFLFTAVTKIKTKQSKTILNDGDATRAQLTEKNNGIWRLNDTQHRDKRPHNAPARAAFTDGALQKSPVADSSQSPRDLCSAVELGMKLRKRDRFGFFAGQRLR